MSVNASSGDSDNLTVGAGITLGIILTVSVGYLVALFVAGVVGLFKQIATPEAHIEFNGSAIVMITLPLVLFAYLTTPELRDPRTRQRVALVAALVGTVVCAAATTMLAPGIDRPSSFEFAAAAYLLFAGCGLLPALVVARGYVFFDRDTRVAAAGDHYLDTGAIEGETKRLIAKHAPTLKAPPSWRPPALFGAKDALTHADLRRILSCEEEEARRLRDIHETRAVTAQKAREDAHSSFILSLSPEERALFQATLRADVEAVSGAAAQKAALEGELELALATVEAQHQEIAALTDTLTTLRGVADLHDALEQSLAQSERRCAGQAHEIDWLWGERASLTAAHRAACAQNTPIVRTQHSSRGATATTKYGGRQ